MAPAKRPAATAAAKATAKRGRKTEEDPFTAQISKVSQALSVAEDFPESVRSLLSSLTVALALPKADRHQFQHEAARLVGEALEITRAAKASKVAGLEAKLAAADTEKAATVAAAQGAAVLLEEKEKDLKAAEESTTKATEAASAAAQGHAGTLKEQEVGDAESAAASEKKAKLEVFLGEYATTKEGKATAAWVKELVKVGKDYCSDPNLFQSAQSALKQAPEARGDFDKLVIGKLDEALSGALAKLQEVVDTAEPAKAARAAKVAEAVELVAKTNAELEAAQTAQKAAQLEVKSATTNKKAAEKAVKTFDSDLKRAAAELEAAKADVAAHGETIATFDALLSRAVAVVPPPTTDSVGETPLVEAVAAVEGIGGVEAVAA